MKLSTPLLFYYLWASNALLNSFIAYFFFRAYHVIEFSGYYTFSLLVLLIANSMMLGLTYQFKRKDQFVKAYILLFSMCILGLCFVGIMGKLAGLIHLS